VESLLPRVCCPIKFMVTSSGAPWLQMETHRVVADNGSRLALTPSPNKFTTNRPTGAGSLSAAPLMRVTTPQS